MRQNMIFLVTKVCRDFKKSSTILSWKKLPQIKTKVKRLRLLNGILRYIFQFDLLKKDYLEKQKHFGTFLEKTQKRKHIYRFEWSWLIFYYSWILKRYVTS